MSRAMRQVPIRQIFSRDHSCPCAPTALRKTEHAFVDHCPQVMDAGLLVIADFRHSGTVARECQAHSLPTVAAGKLPTRQG